MNIEERVEMIVDGVADLAGLNSCWDPQSLTAMLDSVADVAIGPDGTLTLTLYVDYGSALVQQIQLDELAAALRAHVGLE